MFWEFSMFETAKGFKSGTLNPIRTGGGVSQTPPGFRMLVKSRGMDLESSSFLTFPNWQLRASADEVTFFISYLVWLLEGAKVG